MRARTAIVSSVADQGVAALTNILVLVAAARLSTVDGFARFSSVYLVFTVLLGISGAYTGQPLVLRRGRSDDVRGACRSAVVFTLLVAAALGALLAAGCLFVPGDTARALLMLGLVLPVVLGQDAMRYAFSTLQLPHLALAADVLRLVCVLGALTVQPHGAPAARLVAVWGLSALPALLLSAALLHRQVAGTPLRLSVLLKRGHLGQRFVVEFGVGNATSQLSVLGLGVFGNPLVVGALRGATTLFGPLNVLFTSATSFGPPLLGRLGSERRRVRATAGLAAVLAATAAAWATALALLPDGVGRHLLGDTWPTASALLPATGSQYTAMAVGTCGLLALRMLDPRTTLSIQVVFSLAAVAFLAGGYVLGGVPGAAWGLCLGSVCKAVATWVRVARLRRRTVPEQAPVSVSVVRSGP
ncbi:MULTISPECIES: hypothetical protein [unclassified Streptomyces]|uniref:hypothetical protein n=1 Tax=unclassified Streptomyces TaxID=2593676 RepID=UPI002DDB9DBB|nr:MULTISPECIES: hypothetical protein [unclassified Streptomyces]WSC35013.1 hypothetical protein OHA08_05495 [Streptomyces sp. NBC_01763]WSC57712.1 hypothetical protein OG808_38810 [Streptomyces sp. NBC_01761]WSF88815.1 hypothetical protein OIE70_40360 [Streptomyces sp. NBC_01744]WSJ55068.1 hypothetical protein OG243_39215 [Streptomyces sp. NBC_01318]